MIARTALDLVEQTLRQMAAVVLLGPRQVGKTTLAHQLLSRFEGAAYLDLERPADEVKLADPEPYLSGLAGRLVIIDEIQRAPGLFRVLRGLIDARRRQGYRSAQFLLLGSASQVVLAQSSQSLAGRVAYIELPPLQPEELSAKDMDRLWLRGGFPESFLAASDDASWRWRDSFVRTYLERDIRIFAPRVPQTTLRRLWTMLAHEQGALMNVSRLAGSLGVGATSVNRYLDLLTDLMLVRRLQPYFANVGKRLTKSPKIYLRDSGIAHTLLGLTSLDAVLSHAAAGGSWEGLIIEQLIAAAPTGSQPYFFRTAAGAELDLVLDVPGRGLLTYEVKRSSSPVPSKGFYLASESIAATQRCLVYPGHETYRRRGDVDIVPLLVAVARLRDSGAAGDSLKGRQ